MAWIIGGFWLWLVWDAHLHDQTPRATRDRNIEFILKILLAIFYLGLGLISFTTDEYQQLLDIFSEGVCDWSRGDSSGSRHQGTWKSFGPSPINKLY